MMDIKLVGIIYTIHIGAHHCVFRVIHNLSGGCCEGFLLHRSVYTFRIRHQFDSAIIAHARAYRDRARAVRVL